MMSRWQWRSIHSLRSYLEKRGFTITNMRATEELRAIRRSAEWHYERMCEVERELDFVKDTLARVEAECEAWRRRYYDLVDKQLDESMVSDEFRAAAESARVRYDNALRELGDK